jgi:VanZ family protein
MKTYIIRTISLFLTILTAAIIFSLSADTGEESGNLSAEFTEIIFSFLGVDKDTLTPYEYEEMMRKVEGVIRKLAHFSEYAVLGFTCGIFFRTYDHKLWLTMLFSLGFCIPYAALDEWHQSFVPGRGPGIKDVMIDSSGAICGVLFAIMIWDLIYRAAKNRKYKLRYA